MAKLLTAVRSMCPELLPAMKTFESLGRTRHYDKVFHDFIDWLVGEHQYASPENKALDGYTPEEKAQFVSMYNNIQTELRQRASLFVGHKDFDGWYDPLGRMYETITSTFKSSLLGQYFTPEPIADMMAKMADISTNRQGIVRIFDPASGSGRMGLAAAHQAMRHGVPTYITLNDIDPICTKMSALNLAFHGFVGEAINMNGLDLTGDSFRFGYQVAPLQILLKEDNPMTPIIRMMLMFKARQDINKLYLLIPVEYEQTFLKQANDTLLQQYKKAALISADKEREAALKKVNETLQARMKGTLFEGEDIPVDHVSTPKVNTEKGSKKKSNKDKGMQGNLFE